MNREIRILRLSLLDHIDFIFPRQFILNLYDIRKNISAKSLFDRERKKSILILYEN